MANNIKQNSGDIDSLNLQAEWLRSGRLATAASLGNMATDVVIEEKNGTWTVPLHGGIDVVDRADESFMQISHVDAQVVERIVEQSTLKDAYRYNVVEVFWTGTDDVIRHSEANLAAASFTASSK